MKAMALMRDWALVVAMVVGVTAYGVYAAIPWPQCARDVASHMVNALQPALIFMMLFFAFCKVNPGELRPCRWHLWLLLIQGGAFVALGLAAHFVASHDVSVVLQGAMICMICPTATASPVITRKLGGDIAHITTYIIMINLLGALLIPVMVPYVHPVAGVSIMADMMVILARVFPLLLLPLMTAMAVRYLAPRVSRWCAEHSDVSFYLWLCALSLAMAVTVRSLVRSAVPWGIELGLVGVSLTACALQFWLGRLIGGRYDDRVTAGQALGQKNTVFAIWLGYTFFSPVTSLVGGFYTIWHNIVNSYQLIKAKKDSDTQCPAPPTSL